MAIITFAEGAQLLQSMIEAGLGPDDIPIYVADGFKDTVLAASVDPDDLSVLDGIKGTAPSVAPRTASRRSCPDSPRSPRARRRSSLATSTTA